MTKEYNVVWSITIDAATHLHAAFLAKKIQQDPAKVLLIISWSQPVKKA